MCDDFEGSNAKNCEYFAIESNWTSVEDELPENAGEYLVTYHPCYWDNVCAETRVGIDTFRGKTAWAKNKHQRVTHWMPIPLPPRIEECE